MYKKIAGLVAVLTLLAGCGWAKPLVPASPPTLTIEENAVVERNIDQPGHYEFNDRIGKAVLEKRAQWRNLPHPLRVDNVDAANAVLAKFGYKLVAQPSGNGFAFHKGDAVVLESLIDFTAITTSENGKEFAFVSSQPGKGGILVRNGKAEPWDVGAHGFLPPLFVGNDFVELQMLDEKFAVLKNGREVYRGATGPVAVELPLKGLHAWNGKWAVEVKGDVIIEGKSQKHEWDYDELFGWHLLNGKPFFFFRDAGQYGLSYDGQDQGARYDEIVHYKCCEPAMFNPSGNGTMVWFYARKGEMWHYVEAGIYK